MCHMTNLNWFIKMVDLICITQYVLNCQVPSIWLIQFTDTLDFQDLKPNFFSFFFDWAEILAAPPQVYIASVHVKFQPISAIKSGHNSHSKFVNDLIWPFWPLWLMGKFWNFKYGLPICTCGGVAKISEFFGQLFFWP